MSTDETREKSWLAERMEDPDFRVSFAQEWVSLRFCEQIDDALNAKKMRRSELATKLGKSRAWVTQALRKGRNLTIKTMVELAHGLGLEIDIVVRPGTQATERMSAAARAKVEPADASLVVRMPECERRYWVQVKHDAMKDSRAWQHGLHGHFGHVEPWYHATDKDAAPFVIGDLTGSLASLDTWVNHTGLPTHAPGAQQRKALSTAPVVALSS